MSVLYIVIPLAILIASAAIAAFVWAVRGEQFDDLNTPAIRILHDDEELRPSKASSLHSEPQQAPRGSD